MNVYPVLLAGGSGTRLWPVSRQLYPKQLAKFIGEDSLIQSTIKRMTPALNLENIRIVCGKDHVYEIGRHIEEMGIPAEKKNPRGTLRPQYRSRHSFGNAPGD